MQNSEEKLEELFSEILELDQEKIKNNKDADIFTQLKVDSLLALEVLAAAERAFNIKIEDEEVKDLNTFNNILALVNKKIARGSPCPKTPKK